MKHLTIRHFGSLKEADILLDRVNLIIGLQGSGKSCVMMLACYCTWVEKRITLRQDACPKRDKPAAERFSLNKDDDNEN